MKLLFKIFVINILVFFTYSALIEYITKDDWEGFAYAFNFISIVSIQVFVNLILVIIAAVRKKNLKNYLAGLFLAFTIMMYVILYLIY